MKQDLRNVSKLTKVAAVAYINNSGGREIQRGFMCPRCNMKVYKQDERCSKCYQHLDWGE